jgi:hypothetical protein
MASVIAQFIVQQTGQPAIDDGTTATLLANLAAAIGVAARQNPVLTDTGTANTYAVANLSALTAYPAVSGLTIDVSIANANTGASTLNVDGLGAKPILGLALQPLQGGELIVKGVASLLYVVASTVNSGNGAWVLMECAGGAQQIAPATQSNQAVNLGQFASSQSGSGYTKLPNGLIIQWGTYNTTSSQAGNAITFPLAFPNNCFSVSFAPATNNDTLPLGTADSLAAPPSKTGFTVIGVQMTASSNNLSAHTSFFIAIGN